MIYIATLIIFSSFSNGFLLDTSTKPPTRLSLMTDSHFNVLMTLLQDERNSRIQLEQYVKQIQHDSLLAKQEIHTQVVSSINVTFTKEFNELKQNYKDLKTNHDILKNQFEALRKNNTEMKNKAERLEQEVIALRKLKGVTDLQTILDIQNETSHVASMVQATNNDLNFIRNDANARKQDFVALLNRVKITEYNIENKTTTVQANQTLAVAEIKHELSNISNTVTQNQQDINTRMRHIETKQNATELQLQKASTRAAVTACLSSGVDLSNGDIIVFNSIKTITGISNINTLTASGKFVCQKPGLYLVSAYILTYTKNAHFYIEKNGSAVAVGYFSNAENAQTSTAILLQNLSVNDVITVKTSDMYVYGDYQSCLTIVQIR